MSDIDWSKAPDGATHYSPPKGVFIGFWARQIDGVWYYHRNDSEGWHYGRQPMKDEEYIARPSPAWAGEGLPPVGTVCQQSTMGEDWTDVRILAHAVLNGEHVAVFEYGGVSVSYATADEFRPIRTPEQIAAEEREKAILKMLGIIGGSSRRQAEQLYDAGLRFKEAP